MHPETVIVIKNILTNENHRLEQMLKIIKILSLFLFSALYLSGCTGYEIISKLPNPPITVDGNRDDWTGRLTYIEEEDAAVGIANDSDYLYLCYITSVKGDILKIIRMGFTVWFEPSDGKTIGFHYPYEIKNPMRIPKRNTGLNNMQVRMLLKKILKENPEYKIVNDKSFPLGTYALNEREDIRVALNMHGNNFIYELRMPFDPEKKSYSAIQALPGEYLTVRFESGEFDSDDFSGGIPRNGFSNKNRRDGKARIGNRIPHGNLRLTKGKIDFSIEVKLAE